MKNILVLRLGHRVPRDERISTHVALVARAFGASSIYYSGTRDTALESKISDVVNKWGGKFEIEYVENPIPWLSKKREEGYTIIHLTMYGININDIIDVLARIDKMIVIIGGEKVPRKYFEIADYNVAIGHQPHSEVAALAVFLDRIYMGSELDLRFPGSHFQIVGSKKGKHVIKSD